ncbi:MAG: hypothetical protein ABSA42_11275 [Terracidiphilus sp.]
MGSYDSMFNPASSLPGDANRRTLEAVWEEEHVAVFNRQLEREWRDHESPFATAWRGRMVLKNRTVTDEGSDFSPLLQVACDCLPNPEEKASLAKDFHLIQSALATGQLILSNEMRFPRQVTQACTAIPELAQLHYGNPSIEGEDCRLWIKAGAEKEPNRRIDKWLANHLL